MKFYMSLNILPKNSSNLQTSRYGLAQNADTSSRHPIHLVNMGINNDDENSNSQMLYEDGDDDIESGK